MDKKQQQEWWPDMNTASSSPQTPDSPTSENTSIIQDDTDTALISQDPINVSDSANAIVPELSEETVSRESEEPNPYIQYPWNQIPHQPDQNPSGDIQGSYQKDTYQQGYQHPPYRDHTYNRQNFQGHPASPFATAAMIMGIISLLITCCGGSFVFGALGITFALLSRQSHSSKLESQAKTGLILSIIGFVAGIIITIGSFAMLFSPENQEIFQQYQKFYYEFDDAPDEYEDFNNFGEFDFDEFYFDGDDSTDIFEDNL